MPDLLPPPSAAPGLPERPRPAWIRPPRHGSAVALVTVGVLTATGFSNGGYFPGTWGWTALACAWAAALFLVLDGAPTVPRLGPAAICALAGFVGWTALSGFWSDDPSGTGLEAQRLLAYPAALLAAVLVRRDAVGRLLAATWAAIVVLTGYGLLTRLFPERWGVTDPISGYRLAEPVGYWNSLGLLAAMGLLLALGLAARARRPWLRAAAAASLPPLVATLHFTFSRGAWAALAAGAVVTLCLDRRRLQLLATLALVTPALVASVWLAATSQALTTQGSTFQAMSRDGHRLAVALAVASLVAAAAAYAGARAEVRISLPPGARKLAGALLALVLAAAIAGGIARLGSPLAQARNAWHDFASSPAAATPDLNKRLFQLSGNGRVEQWRIAWSESRANPWLGSGAGTYEQYWNRDRTGGSKVVDVHNLYLEVFAELGPFGLALLLATLGIPLIAAFAARGFPLTGAVAGGYVAYLAHAVVDWDWEIPAVTLPALVLGAALVIGDGGSRRRLAGRGRTVAQVAAVMLALLAVHTIATRVAVARVETATRHGDWAAAARDARRASRLAPWSAEPWQTLGEAQLAAGELAGARSSIRHALRKDPHDWQLWLDLARSTSGHEQRDALVRAAALDPLERRIVELQAALRSAG